MPLCFYPIKLHRPIHSMSRMLTPLRLNGPPNWSFASSCVTSPENYICTPGYSFDSPCVLKPWIAKNWGFGSKIIPNCYASEKFINWKPEKNVGMCKICPNFYVLREIVANHLLHFIFALS